MGEILRLVLIPLVVTLVGSIIYGYFSRRKKDYKITCEQLSLRQYKEKESENVKISLSYKNEEVGDALSVLIVRLKNDGKKDISFKQIFEDKIQLKLKNAEIIDVQVENQSENVSAVVEKSEQQGWLLSWGILKKNERIVLKIVSISSKDENDIKSEADGKELEFVFRGNNLNSIEPIHSQSERTFIGASIFTSLLLLALIAIMPIFSSVKYDVVIQGEPISNVDISYNGYTHNFSIDQEEGPNISTKEIDVIALSDQPVITSEIKIMIIVTSIYVLLIIVGVIGFLRHPHKSFFAKLFMP